MHLVMRIKCVFFYNLQAWTRYIYCTLTRVHPFLKYSLPAYDVTFQFHPTDFTQIPSYAQSKNGERALDLLETFLNG